LKKFFFALAAIVFLAIVLIVCAKNDSGEFLARSVEVGGKTYLYRVYLPPHIGQWNTKNKYPIIIFLHGAGERGTDNIMQVKIGIGPALKTSQPRAIVVLPQIPKNNWWTDPDMEKMALAALDKSIEEWNGDKERTYCTGISMGGYGTWSIASHHPEKFAAIVPICGGIKSVKISWHNLVVPAVSNADDPYLEVAGKIICPVKTFHAKDDEMIPVSEQRSMVRALRSLGRPIEEVEYENMGHHIWDETYKNPELWQWLFSQRLRVEKK
jgi:predicted peptidase